jgi:phosphatidylinositol alpha-1,6-mannosyltransferase
MPCRTRNAGWDVEGLGIVYLEASASGLPVIAGDSGGAPDAVLNQQTGLVVSGRNQGELVDACVRLLGDAALAKQMGDAGRIWVEQHWTWDHAAATLHGLLA